MRDKATYIMGGVIILLLIAVTSLLSTNARQEGQIKLLEEKLNTAESVNEGLKDSVDKLIRYQECTAKIFITPRDQNKAIEGDIDDPVTALERCRIEVDGVPISENPPEQGSAPSSQSTPLNSRPQNQEQSNQANDNPPEEPEEPPEPPEEPDPIVGCFNILGSEVCV